MKTAPHFSKPVLAALHNSRILGLRTGTHRFTGVWFVVVNDRLFVRPWNDEPGGWYRAFLKEPAGVMQLGKRELRVRARKTRGERLLEAIDRAYREKYPTPGARAYVTGFARPRRRATTLELLPG